MMKKQVVLAIVLILILSILSACGPNYAKELETLQKDISTVTDDWLQFNATIGERAADIQSVQEVNALYAELSEEAGSYADQYEDLQGQLEGIKGGISDVEYSSVKAALDALVTGVRQMQSQMEDAAIAE